MAQVSPWSPDRAPRASSPQGFDQDRTTQALEPPSSKGTKSSGIWSRLRYRRTHERSRACARARWRLHAYCHARPPGFSLCFPWGARGSAPHRGTRASACRRHSFLRGAYPGRPWGAAVGSLQHSGSGASSGGHRASASFLRGTTASLSPAAPGAAPAAAAPSAPPAGCKAFTHTPGSEHACTRALP